MCDTKDPIPFDPSLLESVRGRQCRDSGGYGVFLFDPHFKVPEEELRIPLDVAEAFFDWAETYPLQMYWESYAMALQQAGHEVMPYQLWKGYARQMIVALLQKHLVDRELPEDGPPELGGVD